MRDDMCNCTITLRGGIKFVYVCRRCDLVAKIKHWGSKGTKKGKHYERHYSWILRRA